MRASSVAGIRRDRDRFVAFAFATADTLIETDCKLNIHYATGAVRWLFGHDIAADGSVNFEKSVAPNHLKLFIAACNLGRKEGRFGALDMAFRRIEGRAIAAQMSGTYLPKDGGRFYFALRSRPPQIGRGPKGLPGRRDKQDTAVLAGAVAEIAEAARSDGQDVNFTLLDLTGLDDLRRRLAPDQAAELTTDIEAQLNARALGGSMVTQVADEAYGVIHQPSMNAENLAQDLSDCAAGYDDSGRGIEVHTATLDIARTELSESEMAKALVYAIGKFTESHGEFTITDLNQGYRDVLQGAGQQIVEIKRLIKLRAFDLAYQPIVALADGSIHHHEALVRFRGDDRNASPYATITFAEDVGLIAALDLAICERAIETVKEVHQAGGQLSLAVNVSGKSLETPVFLERLQGLLKGCGDIREQLLFEVTESSKIGDLEATNRFLQSVRDLGHAVCLDDFGAGAASFQYLRALSVDYVKIDGSYIRDIADDREKQAFVRSMVSLCRDLGIETIAEMIEDQQTVDVLKKLAVSHGQGYLFGKPSMERPQ